MTRRTRNWALITAFGVIGFWSMPVAAVLIAGVVLNELDYLRANIRIGHAELELWLRSLSEQQGLDMSDERAKVVMFEMKGQMPPELWESFMMDWRRAHRK
jgi:hypothetical protein